MKYSFWYLSQGRFGNGKDGVIGKRTFYGSVIQAIYAKQ
jgi:hypothetical protein